jgi:hypothetical protein
MKAFEETLQPMPWKGLFVLNGALVVGCIGALFIVPPTMSFRLFVLICVGTVVLCDVIFVATKARKTGGSSDHASRSQRLPLSVWIVVGVLLLLMFLLNHGYLPVIPKLSR